jgi:hypothetical protein
MSILKVPQTCTNAAVYSQLGCLPISLDASKSVIKFYFQLLQQPVQNITRDVLKLSQDLSKTHPPSWYFKLERSLLSLGFDTSLIGEYMHRMTPSPLAYKTNTYSSYTAISIVRQESPVLEGIN